MKLLRNSYLEILILLYFSLSLFLPGLVVLRLFHTLVNFNQLTYFAFLFLGGFIAAFLSLIGGVICYFFFSSLLLGKLQSVETFYR